MNESVESYKRVVVDGRWDGNVIPGRIEEVAREVFVRPGADVRGGVFGSKVTVEGPCTIEKAVYASGELHVKLVGDILCRSSVGCRRNILCDEASATMRVFGDVIGNDVTLRRTAVLGAVHGNDIRLSECVVLGPVSAANRAIMSDCCVLTASADEIQLGPGNSVIMPYLMARKDIQVSAPVGCALVGDDAAAMTETDLLRHDEGVTLSIGRRMTDLGQVEQRMRDVLAYLQDQVMQGHLAGVGTPRETGREYMPEIVRTLLAADGRA